CACVGKTIEQSLWLGLPDESAVLALINKEPGRISGAEINSELQMIFGRDGLQTFAFVSKQQFWCFAFLVFFRQESTEYAIGSKINRPDPLAKVAQQTIPRRLRAK